VRFHVLPPRAFKYGLVEQDLEGLSVHVSDLERTLLDGLDHPRVFGGVDRGLETLKTHVRKAEHRRLIYYAQRGSSPSTCQRLGALLERGGMRPSALQELRLKARQTQSLLSMNPDAPRTGRVNKTWNVVENDL
jgi:predicted transcriptional regulator of viral defense system